MKSLLKAIGILILAAGSFAAAVPAEEEKPGDTSRWNDFLKNIEAGPGVLNIGGSLRLRYSFYNHFNIAQYDSPGNPFYHAKDSVLLERLRFNFDYRLKENLHAFVQIQDSHAWFSALHNRDFRNPGSETGHTNQYENPLYLKKGFVEWERIGGSDFGFKVGRQKIEYRDKRVWGPFDWANVGRYTWDAAKIYWDTEFAKTDFIGAWRIWYDPRGFDSRHHANSVLGFYSQLKNLGCDLDLFYHVNRGNNGTTGNGVARGDFRKHSVGAWFEKKLPLGFDYGGFLAFQFGREGHNHVHAYGYRVHAGYTFHSPCKSRFGLEYSIASGDDNLNDDRVETFDGLFGYSKINALPWRNLIDYRALLRIWPTKKFDMLFDYHLLQLAEKRGGFFYVNQTSVLRPYPAVGGSGSTIGQQADVFARWIYSREWLFYAGWSHFFASSYIRNTGRSRDADWIFFQAQYMF